MRNPQDDLTAGAPRRRWFPRFRYADLPVRAKLLAPFTLLMLVWGILGTAVLARNAQNDARGGATAQLAQAMDGARAGVTQLEADLLKSARFGARTVNVATAIASNDAALLAKQMSAVLAGSEHDLLIVTDTTGRVLVRVDNTLGQKPKTTTGGLLRDAEFLKAIRDRSGEARVKLGSRGLTALVPVLNTQGSSVGAILVSDGSPRLMDMVRRTTTASVVLFTLNAERIGSIGDALPYNATERGVRVHLERKDPVEALYGPLIVGGAEQGTVAVGMSQSALGGAGWDGSALALLVAGIVVLVLAIGIAAARTVTDPIAHLVDATRSLGRGDLSSRARSFGHDEVGRLAGAFNTMADELQASYEGLERKVAERTAELADANTELQRVSNAKSSFLATMSHELRTPLNAIIGFGDMLSDTQLSAMPAKQRREMAGHIVTSGRHLLTLINDLLDHAQIEAGKTEMKPELCEVADLLREVGSVIRPLAAQKQISLALPRARRLPTVVADRKRLRQILFNLISNGINYTQEGGRVSVSARPIGTCLQIAVADNGPGMQPDECALIFEPFERGTAAPTAKGVGLGLALARQLVELHGGRLWVESDPGRGSTFFFTLPLADPRAAHADQTAAAS